MKYPKQNVFYLVLGSHALSNNTGTICTFKNLCTLSVHYAGTRHRLLQIAFISRNNLTEPLKGVSHEILGSFLTCMDRSRSV